MVLSFKGNDGMIAFIAAGINVNAIVPMGKDFMFKIEDLFPKKTDRTFEGDLIR